MSLADLALILWCRATYQDNQTVTLTMGLSLRMYSKERYIGQKLWETAKSRRLDIKE